MLMTIQFNFKNMFIFGLYHNKTESLLDAISSRLGVFNE